MKLKVINEAVENKTRENNIELLKSISLFAEEVSALALDAVDDYDKYSERNTQLMEKDMNQIKKWLDKLEI